MSRGSGFGLGGQKICWPPVIGLWGHAPNAPPPPPSGPTTNLAYDFPVPGRILFPLCRLHAPSQLCIICYMLSYLCVISRSLCYWLLRCHLRFVSVCFSFPPRSRPVHVPPSQLSRFIIAWFVFRFYALRYHFCPYSCVVPLFYVNPRPTGVFL